MTLMIEADKRFKKKKNPYGVRSIGAFQCIQVRALEFKERGR
jgi:hypothetical protein